jgi:hypothetical protein
LRLCPTLNRKLLYYDRKARMQKGFIFQAGRFRTLPFPTGTWVDSCALASLDAEVCNVFDDGGAMSAVMVSRWGPGNLWVYDVPGATETWVNGLNDNNTVAAFVGETETEYKAHGWWLQGYGGDTVVEDVNDAGLMAVTCHNSLHEGAVTSYAYDGERWVELTVPDSCGTVVTRVSQAGHLVGYYFGLDGEDHGFIAEPALDLAQQWNGTMSPYGPARRSGLAGP